MKDKITNFAIEHPKRVLWITLIFTLLVASQIVRIHIDTDPENMLPEDQHDRMVHNQIKQRFQLYDLIVVGIVNQHGIYNPQSLENLRKLSDDIKQIEGVVPHELMSLATVDNISQEGPGTIRFNWMLPKENISEENARQIENNVSRLPMFLDSLVSSDGKAAAIYVPIEAKEYSHEISQQIQALTDQLQGSDEYHITGLPVAEDTFGIEMFKQMAISAPLAGLAIFLLMWVFFRSFSLITAPMLVAMSTVLVTMGLLIGTGFTVHIMSSMIPIFLMPIAVVDSIHILSEFAEIHKPGSRVKDSIRHVVGNLFQPMLFTSVTSAVGFASLAFTPIPPVQVFGLFVAFGIGLAFILTIVFIPAYIAVLSPASIEKLAEKHAANESALDLRGPLNVFHALSGIYAKPAISAALVISVFSFIGIKHIGINDNPVRWFKEDHRIRVADKILNEHFAGTYDAYLVLRKDNSAQELVFDKALNELASNNPAVAQLMKEVPETFNNFSEKTSWYIQAADDASFDATDDSDIIALDTVIALAEKNQSSSKYFASPEALAYVEDLQAALQTGGVVGKSNSFADLVKTVYRELQGGNEDFYRLPDNARQTAQTVLSYQSSHRPADLWHFVSPDYNEVAVWMQLKSGDNKDMAEVIQQVNNYVKHNPLPAEVSLEWGGLTYINVIWQDAMVKGMIYSLMGAFVMVFAVMVILFRSVIFGALAMIPLSFTIAFIYGLIGWIGKDYDMPVAVLSSLTLGLSVDFAIHFLDRARTIQSETGNWKETLALMFDEPGIAILRNAIVISIGFLPLLAAPLVPYNTVGIFLASIMAASCVVTLILLPAILTVLQKMIFKDKQKDKQTTEVLSHA